MPAKFCLRLVLCLLVALPTLSIGSPSNAIGVCTGKNELGFVPKESEVAAHRLFTLPTITYPFGTKLNVAWGWGLDLTFRIDEQGRVVCYMNKDAWDQPVRLNEQRRKAFESLANQHYSPFMLNGTAVPAIVQESIAEEEAPEKHRDLPSAPLEKVQVSLERTACYGTCPSYRLTLQGNGDVTYEGIAHVVVMGTHHYHVDPQVVAALIASARAKNLASLRPAYLAQITDSPTYEITLQLDDHTIRISDYVGPLAGMPHTVRDFEQEIDAAANSSAWIHLSQPAVDTLEAEHFVFNSEQGRQLLLRAVSDEETQDDRAILRLIDLDAPWKVSSKVTASKEADSVLDEALENQRDTVVSILLAKGALNSQQTIDQGKLDAAFRAAIEGGRLELVQQIWDAGGEKVHPALSYEDDSGNGKATQAPVILLLSRAYREPKQWESVEIARWLVAKGCDIRSPGADGRTLLHVAAEGNDIDLVRYALAQGIPASTPGKYSLPPVESTKDEDVALVLLQAGTDFSKSKDTGAGFRRYAREAHWARTIAWLDTHKIDGASRTARPQMNPL